MIYVFLRAPPTPNNVNLYNPIALYDGVTEAGSLVDSEIETDLLTSAISEIASALETVSATKNEAGIISETLAGADTVVAIRTTLAAIVETLMAADSVDATISGGGSIHYGVTAGAGVTRSRGVVSTNQRTGGNKTGVGGVEGIPLDDGS